MWPKWKRKGDKVKPEDNENLFSLGKFILLFIYFFYLKKYKLKWNKNLMQLISHAIASIFPECLAQIL